MAEEGDALDTQRSVGMELRCLSNLIRRKASMHHSSHRPKDYVTMMHGQAITYLFMNQDRDVFQRDLEQAFEIRGPTATKILQSMERGGLVTRHEVDYDARLKKIRLTEKAVMVYGMMAERMGDFEKMLTKGLTEEEIAAFIAIVDKIKQNLE